jgi:large subunit ribosomal protein L4
MADDTPTLQAAAFTAYGTARDAVTLPSSVFDGTVNVPVMHQAVKAYLANQRQATASTKTRGLVTGGNQKPWRQKGTGRARQGSTRAPHWPGGGTVFGPHGDRNYRERVPRQVRALARKSAFNARAQEAAVIVVDTFAYERPKTALLRAALERIGVADRKVLILTDGAKPTLYLSARNLPNVHTLPYADASTYHVLWSDVVVIESSALGQDLAPISEQTDIRPTRKRVSADRTDETATEEAGEAAPPKKRAVKKAASAAAKKASAAKKTAAKKPAARKPATKKTAAKKSASKKKRS